MRYIRRINAFLPLIVSIIIIVGINLGEKNMENAWWISIVVALITVAGSLVANFYLFKKDSNTIGSVKADTSLIGGVSEDSKRTREAIMEEVLPSFKRQNNFISKIDMIAEDVAFRRRIESEAKLVLGKGASEIAAAIAKMEKTILEQIRIINSQSEEIDILKIENESLTIEAEELRERLNSIEKPRHHGMSL